MQVAKKKTILIIIASSAGILLLIALGLFLYFYFQFSLYQDEQYKFSIRYPTSWKVIVHPQQNVAVVFMRPKDTSLDTLQENFNVTIQPMPNSISTLEQFSATIKNQMTAVFSKSINIVQDKSIRLGWREGHQLIIEAPNPDQLKMVNAWVLKGSQAYIMTFLGNIDKYPQDSFYINEMIHSLKLQE